MHILKQYVSINDESFLNSLYPVVHPDIPIPNDKSEFIHEKNKLKEGYSDLKVVLKQNKDKVNDIYYKKI